MTQFEAGPSRSAKVLAITTIVFFATVAGIGVVRDRFGTVGAFGIVGFGFVVLSVFLVFRVYVRITDDIVEGGLKRGPTGIRFSAHEVTYVGIIVPFFPFYLLRCGKRIEILPEPDRMDELIQELLRHNPNISFHPIVAKRMARWRARKREN